MKIVFLALASSFTIGMDYQDNCFCDVLLNEGHKVTIISNSEKYVNGKIEKTKPEIMTDGNFKLIRLDYNKIISDGLSKKIRMYNGVRSIIEQEVPDIIFCHGICYYSILDVVKYKMSHPEIPIYADTHTSFFNSASNWISLNVLHKLYYKALLKKIEPYLEKFYYIGNEELDFAVKVYKADKSKMEFLPLGGFPLQEEIYQEYRLKKRSELNIENEILIIHSGKLEPNKKTEMLLRAFIKLNNTNVRLIIIGSIPENMKSSIMPLIESDQRIMFLGWKHKDELKQYLCACDIYCQPGSVSATLQNAICCRCAIISYPHDSYVKDYDYGNIVWERNEDELYNEIKKLCNDKAKLTEMVNISKRFGEEVLDYRKIVTRFVNGK